jgi:CubicO group peptidase (beta-lactamase class C family)
VISGEFVRDVMEEFDVPGTAVGLLHGDDEVVAGFGITSVENPLAVDSDTLFQIGSISKTYTATATMRLVETRQLDLDEPVRTYLPGLRLADELVAKAVTMRHLLSHTGGWAGDYFASVSHGDDALAQMVARLDRLEQLTPLGEVWSYNNAGFYIAGRVIEVVTGMAFEEALRELVLDPLGLERSFFFAGDVITHRFAIGHDRTGGIARPWSIGRPAAPVGGLIASVPELLRYARAQWEGGTFLSHHSLAEMRRPHADVGRALGDAMGLGWFVFERDAHAFLTHGGSTSGQQALLLIAPEHRFALAVLTNHDNGSAVYRSIQAEVLRARLGIDLPDERNMDLSPERLGEYAGDYDSLHMGAKLAVIDGELILEVIPKGGFPEPDSASRPGPPATRLAFEGKDRVIALDPPLKGARSDFLRGPQNEIAWFRSSGRLHRRAT